MEEEQLPEHLQHFKEELEKLRFKPLLPVIQQLTPRTKRTIALLPPPNDLEREKIEQFLEMSKTSSKGDVYSKLIQSTDKSKFKAHKLNIDEEWEQKARKMHELNEARHAKANSFQKLDPLPQKSSAYYDSIAIALARQKKQADKFNEFEKKLNPVLTKEAIMSSLPGTAIPKSQPSNKPSSSAAVVKPSVNFSSAIPVSSFPMFSPAVGAEAPISGTPDTANLNIGLLSLLSQPKAKGLSKGASKKAIGKLGKSSSEKFLSPHTVVEKIAVGEAPPLFPIYAPVVQEVGVTEKKLISARDQFKKLFSESFEKQILSISQNEKFINYIKDSTYDEIGLDLDKAYTKARLNSKQLKTIVYYFVLSRQRAALLWLHEQAKRLTKMRYMNAIFMLQRCFRGTIDRRRVDIIKENIRLQKAAEDRARRAREWMEYMSAIKVFVILRRRLVEKRIGRRTVYNYNSTEIQRVFRGHLGRNRAALRRQYLEYCRYYVTIIQCFWRCVQAKRTVVLLRKLKFVNDWMANAEYLHQSQRLERMKLGALLTIQKFYRSTTMRYHLRTMIYWCHRERAVRIQRFFQRFVARINRRKKLVIKLANDRKRYLAAVCIQKYILRYYVKINYAIVKRERVEEERQKRLKHAQGKFDVASITKADKVFFRYRDMRKKYDPMYYLHEEKMAVLIQKRWRGVHGRKRAFIIKSKSFVRKYFQAKDKIRNAAVQIQRLFRGHSYRKKSWYKYKFNMAFKITRCVRRVAARKKLVRELFKRDAGCIISNLMGRRFREKRVRRKYIHQQYLSMFVQKIQCFFRKYVYARPNLAVKLSKKRVFLENKMLSEMKLLQLRVEYQLGLIRESFGREIGSRGPYPLSGEFCLGHGPLQALFIFACGSKGHREFEALTSSRIDSKRFIALLELIPGLTVPRKKKRLDAGFSDILNEMSSTAVAGDSASSISSAENSEVKATIEEQKPITVEDKVENSVQSAVKPDDNVVAEIKPIVEEEELKPENPDEEDSELSSEEEQNSDEAPAFFARESFLIQAAVSGLLLMPAGFKPLSKTDIDIAYAKFRDPHDNGMDFAAFVKCFNYLAKIHFHDRTIVNFEQPKSEQVSPNRRSSVTAARRYSTLPRKPISTVVVSMNQVGTGISYRGPFYQRLYSTRNVLLTDSAIDYSFTEDIDPVWEDEGILRGKPEPQQMDYGFSLVVKILLVLGLAGKSDILRLLEWLNTESYIIYDCYAMSIQNVARKYLDRRRVYAQYLKDLTEWESQMYEYRIIQCQKRVRGFIARQIVAHMAQCYIVRYVPYNGDPSYFVNPFTNVSVYKKPKILKGYDALSVPLPAQGLENIITCGNCNQIAVVNCKGCDESLCSSCFDSLHCKGKRKNHESYVIEFCSYCQYQMATKSCFSCSLQRPSRASPLRYMLKKRGIYCDTCFSYYHDACQHVECMQQYSRAVLGIGAPSNPSLHPSRVVMDRRSGFTGGDNCVGTGTNFANVTIRDAYLIRQLIKTPLLTKHKYDSIIQSCEECKWRSAVWRCSTCDQVYCNTCLIGLHSLPGAFSRHKAEILPYYTPVMHKRYQRDSVNLKSHVKFERIVQDCLEMKEEFKAIAIVRLQAWWRKLFYMKRGKQMLVVKRRQLRRVFLMHKRDDINHRSKLSYRMREFFGWAPALKSDTPQERAMKELPMWRRQRALEYVRANMDDWGFYRAKPGEPVDRKSPYARRKGKPKTGFNVGTAEELCEQAKFGGFRLPGRVLVEFNKCDFKCTEDLRGILNVGEMVRIHESFFKVKEVGDYTVKLNRRWRFLDQVEVPQEGGGPKYKANHHALYDDMSDISSMIFTEKLPGQVMYRVPNVKGEKDAWYYNLRYNSYDWFIKNPIASSCLQYYAFGFKKVANFGFAMAKRSRDRGQDTSFRSWLKWAKKHHDRVEWAESYLNAAGVTQMKRDKPSVEAGVGEVRRIGEYWIAPPEYVKQREIREAALSKDELIASADEWRQEVDPLTEQVYYVHIATKECVYNVPAAVKAKQSFEEENAKKVASLAEAQSRINTMNKGKGKNKRKLM